jgi:hypothetical protein
MLTGKDLIALGLKSGPDFSRILKECRDMDRDTAIAHAMSFIKPEQQKVRAPFAKPDSVLEWLISPIKDHTYWTNQRTGEKVYVKWKHHTIMTGFRDWIPPFLEGRQSDPTNSEIKRLLENRSVLINGFAPPPDGSMLNQLPVWQVIFFPKSKDARRTLIDDPRPVDANPWFDCDGNPLNTEAKLIVPFLDVEEQLSPVNPTSRVYNISTECICNGK